MKATLKEGPDSLRDLFRLVSLQDQHTRGQISDTNLNPQWLQYIRAIPHHVPQHHIGLDIPQGREFLSLAV
jgi:hypothetical protein